MRYSACERCGSRLWPHRLGRVSPTPSGRVACGAAPTTPSDESPATAGSFAHSDAELRAAISSAQEACGIGAERALALLSAASGGGAAWAVGPCQCLMRARLCRDVGAEDTHVQVRAAGVVLARGLPGRAFAGGATGGDQSGEGVDRIRAGAGGRRAQTAVGRRAADGRWACQWLEPSGAASCMDASPCPWHGSTWVCWDASTAVERRTAISGTTWLEQGAANTNHMDAGIRHGANWLARRWRGAERG